MKEKQEIKVLTLGGIVWLPGVLHLKHKSVNPEDQIVKRYREEERKLERGKRIGHTTMAAYYAAASSSLRRVDDFPSRRRGLNPNPSKLGWARFKFHFVVDTDQNFSYVQ